MLAPQLFFPNNLAIDYGNPGSMVNVGQHGGPQGNPLGTIQPRPYPTTDAVGNPISFGMSLIPPGYGSPVWVANLPVNNRQSAATASGIIENLIKQPSPVISF